MSDLDIIKGVNSLEMIAKNLNNILDYINANNLGTLLVYTDEIHNACSTLTTIFEKEFLKMAEEKERMEDDGK